MDKPKQMIVMRRDLKMRKAKAAGILSALICDSGLTEFHGQPTYTCLAFEPALPEKVDPITGELPLF